MNWIYLLLIVAGFLPLIVVLYKMKKIKRWRRTGVATTATVIKVPIGFYNRLNTVSIQYSIKETGQVIEKKIIVAGNVYTIGQQLPLLYKKEKPTDTLLDSGKSYTILLVFTIFIALLIITAFYLIRKAIAEGVM